METYQKTYHNADYWEWVEGVLRGIEFYTWWRVSWVKEPGNWHTYNGWAFDAVGDVRMYTFPKNWCLS